MAEEKKEEGGEAASGASAEATPASGGNQKLLVIALAVNTVVMAALAIMFWLSYNKKSEQVTLADVATSPEVKAGAQDTEADKNKTTTKPEELNVTESFAVNLANTDGSHFAKVEISIETEDSFVKDQVIKMRPKIRDFVIVILSSKTYDQLQSPDGRDFLKEEIRNKINGYLTRGRVKDVHFTEFIVQ